jgi:CDP-glucose 4,6-dehydratase
MVENNIDINFWRGKKVLITGNTGFKGSWMCIMLNYLGARVFGFALDPPTDPNLFVEARVESLTKSFIGDIRDYKTLEKIVHDIEPEIIIHMAAQSLVRESYRDPVTTYSTNVMGTVNLLDICRKTDSVKVIVNITSDKCYENREWHWGYRENEPMGGYDPYSNSKGCSELVTSAFRNSYFNHNTTQAHEAVVASARAGNVIGGGDWASNRLIPDIIRSFLKKEIIKIRNPKSIRPWQHVLEPISGYLLLAEKCFKEGHYFAQGWNFGSDDRDAKDVEWITKMMCKLWGRGASYELDTEPGPHEANYLKLDSSKSKMELGWYPKWNIEKSLTTIVEWNLQRLDKLDMLKSTEKQIEIYLTSALR